jgi:hypothetical protein
MGVFYTLPNCNTVSGVATNGTVSAQTTRYQSLKTGLSDVVNDQANATSFGKSAAQATLGTPILTQDTNLQTPGTPYFSDEYILYQSGTSQNAILFELGIVGPS